MTLATESPEAPEVQLSKRGARGRQQRILTPMEQIRVHPAGVKGAWAYYLRPDGATIRDALILYPNGGIPDDADPKMRAKYGANAEYYRARQAQKGFIFLGSSLTEEGMKKLVEVLAANAEDEVLYCQEKMADCELDIASADVPEVRAQARRRLGQFSQRIQYIQQELDPESLLAELKEISRAQQLSSVDPNILKVMKALIGEVSESLSLKIAQFQKGKVSEGEPSRGVPISGGNADEFEGADFIDV